MNFTLYPAIDLKDGECVRLTQGEMTKATVYESDPAKQAAAFEAQGFSYLHVVDLNGAFEGKPVNEDAVRAILDSTNMSVQLGGGIRTIEMVGYWLMMGVSRVILGTAAQSNPTLVREACSLFPNRIVVGIDARGGLVATEGWAKQTSTKAVELAKQFEDAGVSAIIYTDIMRDGTLEGPNVEETVSLAEQLSIPVIASGGIRNVDDVRNYISKSASGIEGAIAGKSIYEGSLDVAEALKLIRQ